MIPFPLFGNPVQQFIDVNAMYWHVADNDNYRLNLITNTNLNQTNTLVSSTIPQYSTILDRRGADLFSLNESGSNFFEWTDGASSGTDAGFTVFQVRRYPGNSLQFYTTSSTRREFIISNNGTSSGSVRGISFLAPNGITSRFQFEYRTAPSPASVNQAQTIDIKNEFGANYLPSFNGMVLDVIRIGKTTNYPTVYATRNGRGSSGSPYHKASSSIAVGGGTAWVGGNFFQPIKVWGDSPVDPIWTRGLRVHECIVFNSALIQSDINLIETYLRNKWNLSY
jgi:hypothetical protein